METATVSSGQARTSLNEMDIEGENSVVAPDMRESSNHLSDINAQNIVTVVRNKDRVDIDADEDWLLLEPEEELPADQSEEEENNQITMEQGSMKRRNSGSSIMVRRKISNAKGKTNGKTYIELDSLGPSHKYSRALMHLCAAVYSLINLSAILAIFTLLGLLFTRYYLISLLYFGWIIYDRDTCNEGGRRANFVYYSAFWKHLAAYFPIRLRHSEDFKLDPSENYILNYHPHGIAAFGSVCTFSTNGLNFDKLFPGIRARFMVHESCFVLPVIREIFSLRGDCSVNSKSFDYILSQKNRQQNEKGEAAKDATGNLLAVVVGGLAEADLSDSETLKTVLLERKGFIKKALIHGANLIPCIAFGENSVFTKVELSPSSLLKQFETRWYNLFKFKHPIYYGRSLFSKDSSGLMPYKRPITVVMGDPIPVELNKSPSQEEIDQLHANYIGQLTALYESNNDLCKTYDKKLIPV